MQAVREDLIFDRFPHLAAVAGHFSDADADERFGLLIDISVSGLAQRAPGT